MKNWRDDLSQSRTQFVNIVWPNIKFWFDQGSELIQVEEIQDSYAELLDKEAGIDYLIKDKIGIRPISARVQDYSKYNYKTLTLREKRTSGAKTEFEKLVKRINTHYLHPWIHIQAYVDFHYSKLMHGYAVKVIDLINALNFKSDSWYRQINKSDGNVFLVFNVISLLSSGIEVMVYNDSLIPSPDRKNP